MRVLRILWGLAALTVLGAALAEWYDTKFPRRWLE
jgi:hypothetical protein